MQLQYTVHSVVVEKVEVTATFKDKPMTALVAGLVIELVGVGDGNNHGHTFHYIPVDADDMKRQMENFQIGNVIQADFAPVTAQQSE